MPDTGRYNPIVSTLRGYCRFLLAYNLAVIVWGAYVRATGSGAGCGSHWPLCNGEVLPAGRPAATWIEYSHRLSSGLVLVLAAVLVAWAFRAVPRGHALLRWAAASFAFTLSEAAVGAGLVLLKLVAHDESVMRAVAISAHLLNTLLLLAALTLTAHAADALGGGSALGAGGKRGGDAVSGAPAGAMAPAGLAHPPQPWLIWALALGMVATMVIAATGAVAALGDTLFPAASLREGLARDLSPASHFLLRLRGLHPLLAVTLGAFLLYLCQQAAACGAAARRQANRLRLLVLGQWALGVVNLGLLAPLPLQLLHLLAADLVWISLVLLAVEILAGAPAVAADRPLVPATGAASS